MSSAGSSNSSSAGGSSSASAAASSSGPTKEKGGGKGDEMAPPPPLDMDEPVKKGSAGAALPFVARYSAVLITITAILCVLLFGMSLLFVIGGAASISNGNGGGGLFGGFFGDWGLFDGYGGCCCVITCDQLTDEWCWAPEDLIELRETVLDVTIVGQYAEIAMEQTYVSVAASQEYSIEYVFPGLGGEAVAWALNATIEGREVIAKIFPADVAQAKYDEAVSMGQTAVLATNEPGAGWTLALGAVQPGDELVVKLFFTVPAKPRPGVAGQYEFRFPRVAPPRPSWRGFVDVGDLSLDPTVVLSWPQGVGFVSSPSHTIQTAFDAVEGNKLVTVTIPSGNVAAAGNMDFVLYYGLATGAANNVSVDVLSFVDTQISGDAFLAVEVSAEGAAVFTNISVEVPAAVNLEFGVEQGVRADNTPSTYTFVGVRSGAMNGTLVVRGNPCDPSAACPLDTYMFDLANATSYTSLPSALGLRNAWIDAYLDSLGNDPDEFERVGLRYSVLTQETSFLAVDAWGALSNDTTANEDAGGDFAAADGAQASSIVGRRGLFRYGATALIVGLVCLVVFSVCFTGLFYYLCTHRKPEM